MKSSGVTALMLVLIPRTALACATCITSPFGDRTYTWPYYSLLLLPFGLVVAVAGILAYHAGYRPRSFTRWLAARFGSKDDPAIIKETT
jgi:hypothetical protein